MYAVATISILAGLLMSALVARRMLAALLRSDFRKCGATPIFCRMADPWFAELIENVFEAKGNSHSNDIEESTQ